MPCERTAKILAAAVVVALVGVAAAPGCDPASHLPNGSADQDSSSSDAGSPDAVDSVCTSWVLPEPPAAAEPAATGTVLAHFAVDNRARLRTLAPSEWLTLYRECIVPIVNQ